MDQAIIEECKTGRVLHLLSIWASFAAAPKNRRLLALLVVLLVVVSGSVELDIACSESVRTRKLPVADADKHSVTVEFPAGVESWFGSSAHFPEKYYYVSGAGSNAVPDSAIFPVTSDPIRVRVSRPGCAVWRLAVTAVFYRDLKIKALGINDAFGDFPEVWLTPPITNEARLWHR